jgi:hypothetical protein
VLNYWDPSFHDSENLDCGCYIMIPYNCRIISNNRSDHNLNCFNTTLFSLIVQHSGPHYQMWAMPFGGSNYDPLKAVVRTRRPQLLVGCGPSRPRAASRRSRWKHEWAVRLSVSDPRTPSWLLPEAGTEDSATVAEGARSGIRPLPPRGAEWATAGFRLNSWRLRAVFSYFLLSHAIEGEAALVGSTLCWKSGCTPRTDEATQIAINLTNISGKRFSRSSA